MLFCHIYVIAPFAHERIKHMVMYFPRNLITAAVKHVVKVEQIKYRGKYTTICGETLVKVEQIKFLGKYTTICLILSCVKGAIYI